MNYYRALESINRYFAIHNGYSGHIAICGLSYCPDSKQAICVCQDCCFAIGCLVYAHAEELEYYFDNHRFVHFRHIIRLASDKEIAAFVAATEKFTNQGEIV